MIDEIPIQIKILNHQEYLIQILSRTNPYLEKRTIKFSMAMSS